MGNGPFIGLMDNAEYCSVTKRDGQGGERHCYWKKSAGLLHRWDYTFHLKVLFI